MAEIDETLEAVARILRFASLAADLAARSATAGTDATAMLDIGSRLLAEMRAEAARNPGLLDGPLLPEIARLEATLKFVKAHAAFLLAAPPSSKRPN